MELDTIFVRHAKDCKQGSKEYVTDTTLTSDYRDRLLMAGTTIIPNTGNQWEVSSEFQLMLQSVSEPKCVSDREIDNGVDFIRSTTQTDSTLSVSVTIHDNCCYHFLCDVSVVEGGIINLTYIGYGWSICGCMCVFHMDYNFSKSEYDPEVKLTGFMINGKKETFKPFKQ